MSEDKILVQAVGEVIPIPQEAIDRWNSIQSDLTLNIPITKDLIDNLFFSIRNLSRSHDFFQTSMRLWLSGNHEESNEYFKESAQTNATSVNDLNRFIEIVMRGAQPIDGE